ncbi:MAG: transcriptional regulator [Spirochaetes bacterium GWF1_31_7]|nr:MAG: transcriptional regulator [Spirochaetes bacterium GWE1_32_154]OHD47023.1 MAG: transcriptional regulator [Spirochaetes bacterium GWF1_31_7]OHD49798.1 MAG: transcriptional regulator [Spirochaetes bacterium GWE2_31_10]HBD95521.1 transcriptional regulator [Spirochaetia bacterium]HBI36967.1 transcriptional regulator [Spirochaetia bacterium]
MIVMDKKSERYKKMENLQSFVFVKGGTFKNTKSNYYNTQTTLSDFNIGIYEVTQKEWFDIMGNNPSNFKGDTLPVETVSWYDCVEYCNQRSKKEGLKNYYTIDKNKKDPNNKNEDDDLKWTITINAGSNGYRLPTEAEWEYAAGGGQKSLSYELSGSDIATEVAVFYENSNDSTKPVGSKKPNELGLYDMSGNVYEWCWDWYGEEISNGRDPLGPIPMAGLYRLLRGGSWLDSSGIVQVGDRGRYTPGRAGLINGFRVARSN